MTSIGYLEVIAGPMYCGKTEELIRQVKRASIGKKKIQAFKHKIDIRYGNEKKLYSHGGVHFDCEIIESAKEMQEKIHPDTQIIAIDEAQWFGEELVGVIQTLLDKKKHVVLTGLAMTYDKQPFTPIPTLMALADKVTKLSSVCSICGEDAVFHKRVTKEGPKVNALVADPGFVSKMDMAVFQARCRKCFDK
jgi:thymidine kinase